VLSAWQIQTGRLVLQPVGWSDLADLVALKGDPRAFAVMLGGVRTPVQVADELAAEMSDWARLGYGIWTIRDAQTGAFIGLTGLQNRADGRGVGLRFAVRPEQQGHGYASEAAGAALRFAHERAGLARVVAVARADNLSSRQVLGGIGMVEAEAFVRDGVDMLMFEHRAK
jgi:RimJ/RimL family protein N-acetyltransferase